MEQQALSSIPSSVEKPVDSIPYLGSRISLVSKTDIRYEGFLFNIDTRQSTVALQSVRSFGTEGRRTEHVPPSPHVLQYATFKASEIKDLHVCEAAPASEIFPPKLHSSVSPALGPTPSSLPLESLAPPAVTVATTVAAATKSSATLLTPGSVTNAHSEQSQTLEEPTSMLPNQRQQVQQQTRGQSGNNARTIPGMGGHLLKRKERRAPGGTETSGVRPDTVSEEFNFAEGLSDFDKEQEFSKLEEDKRKETTGCYQKSSFFDTISCDALDRLEGQRARMSGAEERKLNTETFGAVGLNNRRSFRGRGRGRGRRGGYRNGNWNSGRGNGNGGGGRNNSNNNGVS
ncbi:unnamed protein product [Peronospora belbahrii]|uniref:DFDF domain-containing protein n=1 Tax=Peronospora belbahrii TaxID=622444 RepID=A0AAU9KTA8_9STRA|nr:unnamed protein product [Peronospora belbahrii]CAH0517630.1 unnamed protein product [Peronospora belbahrii]